MAAALLACATAPAVAEKVLLAFGDSLTQGYGLPPEMGLVPQLQAWLQAHGAEVRVINGGVSGDTTAGGAARIAWSLTEEVDAVMVELGGNDMLRGLDPAAARANLAAILDTITGRDLPVLLIGLPGPENFGPEYKAAFDALYRDLAAQYGVALIPDFMAALRDAAPPDEVLRTYMQGDATHPNAKGVALIVERLGPAVLKLLELAK